VWDRIGLFASVVCIVHCTLTPLFLFFLPVLGAYFESPWVHILLALIVFPAGIFAFFSGYRVHGHRNVLALAMLGFLALGIGLMTPRLPLEILFTAVGGICLSTAHIINLRACRHH
jgi:hypothetical protein